MELYILDSLHRRVEVIDNFESLVWSERFNTLGDIELHIISNLENRKRFVAGVHLGMNLSNRIMIVQTISDITDEDGRRILKITGPSYEYVIRDRVLATNTAGVFSPWGGITDYPYDIVCAMFSYICIDGSLNAGDVISPLVFNSGFYPTDTIAQPTTLIYLEPRYRNLLDAMEEICSAFGIGFRFVKDPSTNLLYFDVYMGIDRTTLQSTFPAVVFSPDLDNLRDTNRLFSSALHKNVAYVMNNTDHVLVYDYDVDTTISGLDRRVLLVECDDGLTTDEMTQKGKDELAKNRLYAAVDGQLATLTSYVYESDYYLGDLVELRNDDGETTIMQVTEQIFVHDKEGERSYPTLSVNSFIYPGSWLAWDLAMEWDDFTTEHWEDLP